MHWYEVDDFTANVLIMCEPRLILNTGLQNMPGMRVKHIVEKYGMLSMHWYEVNV